MILLLLRIELSDYELNLLSCILFKILLVSIRYQAGRNEDSWPRQRLRSSPPVQYLYNREPVSTS